MSREDPSTPPPDERGTTRDDPTQRADDPSDPFSGLIGTGGADEEDPREGTDAGDGGSATARAIRREGSRDDADDAARDAPRDR